jgi:hypothetical protein
VWLWSLGISVVCGVPRVFGDLDTRISRDS